MPKQKKRRISKSKAIQDALGRLGWHASGKDVVAFLANCGIDVNEGLVHKVKMDRLKDSSGLKRQKAKAQKAGQRPAVPLRQKVPAQRSYQR